MTSPQGAVGHPQDAIGQPRDVKVQEQAVNAHAPVEHRQFDLLRNLEAPISRRDNSHTDFRDPGPGTKCTLIAASHTCPLSD